MYEAYREIKPNFVVRMLDVMAILYGVIVFISGTYYILTGTPQK